MSTASDVRDVADDAIKVMSSRQGSGVHHRRGLSSSGVGEEHRTLNPGPPAFQCLDSITVRVLHRDLCAQPCARRGSIKPAVAAG